MSIASSLTIAQPNPDGSLPVPAAPDAAANAAAEALQREAQLEALQAQVAQLQEILAKPLTEILAEHDKASEAAAAWDSFGAMWMLSQRAMRRVAMDLAAQQGVSEQEVVARALAYANQVLNVEDEDLGGTVAPAQLAHIARHKAFLRKRVSVGPNCRAHTPDFSAPAGRVPQSPGKSFSASASSIQAFTPGSSRTRCYVGGDVRAERAERTCAGACTRGQSRRRPR